MTDDARPAGQRPALSWPGLLQAAPYFSAVFGDVLSPAEAVDAAPLVRAAYFYDLFDGQVSNGGVMQYFYNLALSTPGFERIPAFIAAHPQLAAAMPFVCEVHAAWAEVAPAVIEARRSDAWPEALFSAHRERFEALATAFYKVNHAISQRLCGAIVAAPHHYFDIEPIAGLSAQGVAHIVLNEGRHRLRFEDGFPIGPNLLENADGSCNVVWFSRDRALLQNEGGHGANRTRQWIHYPSQVSGNWRFKGGALQSQESSQSLWTAQGPSQRFHADGAVSSVSQMRDGVSLCDEHFFADGTTQCRHEQRADGEHRLRYWPSGALNTESIYDATERRERYLQVLDAAGQVLAPAGHGRLVQFLALDKGAPRWREGTLVNGYLEGPVVWMKSLPDGSAPGEISRSNFQSGKAS